MRVGAARLLAVDLGAETGRAVVGAFDGDRLAVEEAHRFANVPVEVGGTLHWDVLRLHADVLDGLRAAGDVASVGIDTWGVDFGLLDRRGRLLGNPVHYRDRRTEGQVERATGIVPAREIYERTGIQFLPINTLYQLMAMAAAGDPQLEVAERLLPMPALLAHWLGGAPACERTMATTTQCFDVRAGAWALDLLAHLGVPTGIFGEVVEPGTDLGPLLGERGAARVIAPGTHDTASAVAAVPFAPGRQAAFLSAGTWSLVGMELDRPVVSDAAREANLSNEGGVAGTVRLLKNVMGLWLVQECRRAWARAGRTWTYDELLAMAEAAPPLGPVIDPDDERLLRPADMPAQIAACCAERGQPPPGSPGEVVRCALESLALKHRAALDRLEAVTGTRAEVVHVVGGGARNALLCQLTADACGRPVVAGPVEATAIGNLLVQAMALGLVGSLEEARALVGRSLEPRTYEPRCPERREERRSR
jgi:rhamnulokinase